MRLSPRLPARNVNVSKANPLGDFALMLGTLAAAALALYALLGFAVDLVAPRISFEIEQRIAISVLPRQPLFAKSHPAPAEIAALGERVRAAIGTVPHPVDVRVVDMDIINAFALPGGHIVLTSGLIQTLQSENEMAFVLGHEMGHIAARDHLRGMGRSLVLLAMSSAVLGDSGALGDLLGGMLVLTDRSFSRTQEMRADRSGLAAIVGVYGHAGGIPEFFSHLGDQNFGTLAHLALTHPETQTRIAALEQLVLDEGHATGPLTPLP